MRLPTIFVCAVFVAACVPATTSKERLASLTLSAPPMQTVNGREFKKLVLGNTLYRETRTGRGQYVEYMFHFIDDDTLLFSSGQSAPTQEQKWTVTNDGHFCYTHTYRSTRDICWQLKDFDGSAFNAISTTFRNKPERLLLLKGKQSI